MAVREHGVCTALVRIFYDSRKVLFILQNCEIGLAEPILVSELDLPGENCDWNLDFMPLVQIMITGLWSKFFYIHRVTLCNPHACSRYP